MLSENYLATQPFESLLVPQQFTDPLQPPTLLGRNLMSPQTIAFVDPNIADATTVIANLRSDVKILLDPTRDGIAQITEALKNYQGGWNSRVLRAALLMRFGITKPPAKQARMSGGSGRVRGHCSAA